MIALADFEFIDADVAANPFSGETINKCTQRRENEVSRNQLNRVMNETKNFFRWEYLEFPRCKNTCGCQNIFFSVHSMRPPAIEFYGRDRKTIREHRNEMENRFDDETNDEQDKMVKRDFSIVVRLTFQMCQFIAQRMTEIFGCDRCIWQLFRCRNGSTFFWWWRWRRRWICWVVCTARRIPFVCRNSEKRERSKWQKTKANLK